MKKLDNMRVLLTGGTGFVGQQVASALRAAGASVRCPTRRPHSQSYGIDWVRIDDINASTDWQPALDGGIDTVIHLAARVHVMQERVADPLLEYRRVNVDGSVRLAEQAVASGVRRFVFISSIKVNGESTLPGFPFTNDSKPLPQDPYAVSKWEAEQALQSIARTTGMDVVIIRPPLVYGPGVGANFAQMMRCLARGLPLPLGGVRANRRSLVAVDNLVDLIVTCITHPAAANRVFLVSDGEDLSTMELLRRMGQALGRTARLITVPTGLLKLGAILLRRPELYHRLCGSLQIDISATQGLLGWAPPVTVDEGLRRAAQGKSQ